MFNRNVSINLPIEILLEIFSYLSPETVAKVARINKECNIATHDNLFWQEKFKRHFPYIFSTRKIENQTKDYAEFRKAYDDEYKDLPLSVRKLFSLIKESDAEGLKQMQILLDVLDRKDKRGMSLLSVAKELNNQHVLDYLYQIAQKTYAQNKYTIDTAMKDNYERTILYWAIACHQHQEHISSLIFQGSKLDEKYLHMRFQPIHIACEEGRLDVVELLIKKEPNLLGQVDAYGQTPLLWAAAEGHADVVEYLISQGANFNVFTCSLRNNKDNGKTPLYWAADRGHSKVVAALITAGAITTMALIGNRVQPIHIAAKQGRLAVVQLLIEKGSNLLEQVDAYGQTPLLWAVAAGHADVVDYLISKGANLHAKVNGKTPLYWAADRGHSKVVTALLKAGALTLGEGRCQPIHIAVQKNKRDVVQVLIENNPDLLEQADARGRTLLIHAVIKGCADVVDYLISKGANINAVSYVHETPLSLAVNLGQTQVVGILLKNGATLDTHIPFSRSKLTTQVKAKINLLEYISKRSSQPEYKTAFTLFGSHKFNFGFSKYQKLDAANALKNVVMNGADKNTLNQYEGEFNNGTLKSIYHGLRLKNILC